MGESATPVRMRLSRRPGFNLQAESKALNGLEAVVVGRPTKWGNPFVLHHPNGPPSLQRPMTPQLAVSSFRSLVEKEGGWFPVPLPWPKGKIPKQFTTVEDVVRELRGRNLACWCALPDSGEPDHCHAAFLLRLANAPIRCDALPAVNTDNARG